VQSFLFYLNSNREDIFGACTSFIYLSTCKHTKQVLVDTTENVIQSLLLDKYLFCAKQKLWVLDMTKWTKSNPPWKLSSVQMLKAYAHCCMKSNFINYWATFSHLKKASSKDKANADTHSPSRTFKKKKKKKEGVLTCDKFWHWRMLAQKYSLLNLDCFVMWFNTYVWISNTNDHIILYHALK